MKGTSACSLTQAAHSGGNQLPCEEPQAAQWSRAEVKNEVSCQEPRELAVLEVDHSACHFQMTAAF